MAAMKELARAIYDANPSMARDLSQVIDEWRALQLASENAGMFGADLHPDNPEHLEVFKERLARVDQLKVALDELLF